MATGRADLRAARRGTDRLGDPALPVPLVRTARLGDVALPGPARENGRLGDAVGSENSLPITKFPEVLFLPTRP